MTQHEALTILAPLLGDEVCVHANGFLSRAAFAVRDRPGCFYMIGSMGLASSIGLGIALARPDRRVVVFDGDGNVLMNLGTLATIAARAPTNLLHLCFDNGAHASTGGQRTVTDRVALEKIAAAAGYRFAARVDNPEGLREVAPAFLDATGPAFLLVRIALGPSAPPGPRIPYAPPAMTARVRQALGLPAGI